MKKIKVQIDGRTYDAEMKKTSYNSYTVNIDGKQHEISVNDSEDQKKSANSIYAPMHGIIYKILVKEGQRINRGDSLIILSAMKMENHIISSNDSVIKSIHAKEDETVKEDQLLITLNDKISS